MLLCYYLDLLYICYYIYLLLHIHYIYLAERVLLGNVVYLLGQGGEARPVPRAVGPALPDQRVHLQVREGHAHPLQQVYSMDHMTRRALLQKKCELSSKV